MKTNLHQLVEAAIRARVAYWDSIRAIELAHGDVADEIEPMIAIAAVTTDYSVETVDSIVKTLTWPPDEFPVFPSGGLFLDRSSGHDEFL